MEVRVEATFYIDRCRCRLQLIRFDDERTANATLEEDVTLPIAARGVPLAIAVFLLLIAVSVSMSLLAKGLSS